MQNLPLPIPKKSQDEMFSRWLKPAKRKENNIVIYAPGRNFLYRIKTFRERFNSKFNIFTLNLQASQLEDRTDWENFLKTDIKLHRDLYNLFVLTDGHRLFQERHNLLPILADYYLHHTNVSFLIFSDRYPYQKIPHAFMQNICWQSLYSAEDTENYIEYLKIKFNISVSDKFKQKIFSQCGGYFWLIKQILRFIADKRQGDSFDHEELNWRVKLIYDGFSDTEKSVLQQISLNKTIQHSQTLNYLTKTGIVTNRKINIGLLEQYIKKHLMNNNAFELHNQKILLNGVVITNFLSVKDRRGLICLVKTKGKTVKREELAQAFCGDDTEYSDWSLDQAVKRLRNKLVKFGLPKDYIKTLKGQGYLLPEKF